MTANKNASKQDPTKKRYGLVVDKSLWEEFTGAIPRTKTINQVLNEIIEREVKKKRGEKE